MIKGLTLTLLTMMLIIVFVSGTSVKQMVAKKTLAEVSGENWDRTCRLAANGYTTSRTRTIAQTKAICI